MRLKFKKENVALEQLHCAIELFLKQRFIPAITLAGAAEEIYGKSVTLRGRRNAQKLVWNFVSFRNIKGNTEKQVRDAGNQVKNGLKHGAQGIMEFNPKLEAFLLIARAIENFQRLGKTKTDLMYQLAMWARFCLVEVLAPGGCAHAVCVNHAPVPCFRSQQPSHTHIPHHAHIGEMSNEANQPHVVHTRV